MVLDIALGIIGAKLLWMVGTFLVFGILALIGLVVENIKKDV